MHILIRAAYLGESDPRWSAKCVQYRRNAKVSGSFTSSSVTSSHLETVSPADFKIAYPVILFLLLSFSFSTFSRSWVLTPAEQRDRLNNRYFSPARKYELSLDDRNYRYSVLRMRSSDAGLRLRPRSRTERMRIHRYVIIHVVNHWAFESRHFY